MSLYVNAQDATKLFSAYSDRIFQIRIIEKSSGKQATIGSGFLISSGGLIVSNFHVVSEFVHHPDRYRIEYANHAGQEGVLTLQDIDVINDLSLLRLETSDAPYLNLASALPPHGEPIYSLGNPHDLGLTVVPGTFNGITSHSIYERIHVSAAINSGMSGGPTLNSEGEVIGVNVASSGNQVGFLVPLHRLRAFIEGADDTPVPQSQLDEHIRQQLQANQAHVFGDILQRTWQITSFGEARVPSEIAPHIRCWGQNENDPEIRYSHSTTYCRDEENIFLSSHFNSGVMLYRFDWFETNELNRFQFYHLLQTRISRATADNYASKEDVTNYKCHDGFITAAAEHSEIILRASYCAREYKKYPGLYDVLYLALSGQDNDKSLLSYFSLSGVSQDIATQFTRKFISSITWN